MKFDSLVVVAVECEELKTTTKKKGEMQIYIPRPRFVSVLKLCTFCEYLRRTKRRSNFFYGVANI